MKERMSDTENTGIQVYIGDEMPVQTMKDCSVVTATYELGKECMVPSVSSVPSVWIMQT